MDIVKLYTDEKFNNLIDSVAAKKKIRDFDDFRQDVFAEILESKASNRARCVSCINKIASQYYRSAFEDDIYNYGINEDGEYRETENEIMSRLIYQGKAEAV